MLNGVQERRAEMDVSYYHQVLIFAGKVASRSQGHRDCKVGRPGLGRGGLAAKCISHMLTLGYVKQ